jgi:hypothetical protein
MIKLVHRDNIHEQKWRALLMQYRETHPYVSLHYLDAVCKHWSALVFGDYEAVLPFCWNKKWTISYIFQPPFLQQMRYVGPPLSEEAINKISSLLHRHFSFIEYTVNIAISSQTRKNYVLHLNRHYELLANNYSSQTKKNLKAAKAEIVANFTIDQFIDFYTKNTIPKIANWKKPFSAIQETLLNVLEKNDELLLLGAVYEGQLEAVSAVICTPGHLVHLMTSTSDRGRELHGTTVIVDRLIRQYCHQDVLLDFEGSEIAGIARFNEGFGAILIPYFELKSNKLPFPINILKK